MTVLFLWGFFVFWKKQNKNPIVLHQFCYHNPDYLPPLKMRFASYLRLTHGFPGPCRATGCTVSRCPLIHLKINDKEITQNSNNTPRS